LELSPFSGTHCKRLDGSPDVRQTTASCVAGWQIATAVSLAAFFASAQAAEPKVAAFEFEPVDTGLEGATYGPQPNQQRLAGAANQLRDRLAKSGRLEVVDIAAVVAPAPSNGWFAMTSWRRVESLDDALPR
jgi:hypothetical protein